jgi:hypothetical protein
MARRYRRACAFLSAAVSTLVSATCALAAGEAAGTAAAGFLAIGSGASVQSMAGATLASGDDLASGAWNPAALARLDGLQLALSHLPLPAGATQDWLAAGGRLGGGGPGWGLQGVFHREAGIEGRDASNNPTAPLTATDLAVTGLLAVPLGTLAEAGLSAEWVTESLAGATGSGMGFGFGLRGRVGALGLGLAGRHLGGGLSHGGTRYDLPGVIAAGVAWSDEGRGLRVAADLESPRHYHEALRVGVEWRWREQVALRCGYRQTLGAPAGDPLTGATFGIGTGMAGWWMDYGFAPGGGDAAGEHRVGLTFRRGPGRAAGARPLAMTAPAARGAGERAHAPKPAAPRREAGPIRTGAPSPAAPTPAATRAEPAAPVPDARAAAAPKLVAPPQAARPGAPAAAPPATGGAGGAPGERPRVVIVAPGETLADIARRWGTTVAALMMANDLVNDRVQPGRSLQLPAASRR